MARVEVDPVELVGVGADRVHEAHRPVDLLRQLLVARPDRRVAHEVGVPGVHLAQVGVAAGDERTHEVQRRRGRVVDLEQPRGVVATRLGRERVAVDRVAPVGRKGDAVAGLLVRGARLGVLAGEPAELHHGHRRGVGQHHRHLQQHPQLVAHVVGGDAVEGLRAVAALEQERLAAGDRGQLGLELVALAGEDQRRHPAQPRHRGLEDRRVGVRRLLRGPARVEVAQGRDLLGHRSSVLAREVSPGAGRPAATRPRPAGRPRARRRRGAAARWSPW